MYVGCRCPKCHGDFVTIEDNGHVECDECDLQGQRRYDKKCRHCFGDFLTFWEDGRVECDECGSIYKLDE